ncbi:MFS transporter [Frankia sp. Mgl5]|uniref:MFS transporter n=1 Tax=Frankia sp. Mgl5 TaxID=2933793 RepID=UPI00200C87DC|nr:MFS transporter [Frankia sp. Mgl5]MCK9929745.1 MFS transporter [Frankia sp. Mgl5]
MSQSAQTMARARWLAFAALCSMQMMIVIDISVVTVALRSIQDDLGFEQAHLAWVTNAYTVGFGGLLLLAGRLGDLIGRKTVFLTGLVVFTGSSALCGLSRTQEMLIATRFVQGMGAAMAYAVLMSIVFTLFTEPRELGKAMGAFGFVVASGASVGILAGAVVTDSISWHWVFFVNVPIGIAAGVLAGKLLPPDSPAGLGRGVDVLGAILVTGGLMLGVYTIATVGENGWGSVHTIGFGLGAIALLAAFVGREATADLPLIPLGIFRSRVITGANLVHLLLVAATVSFNILVALYLQQVVGYSPLATGFAFLPIAVFGAAASLGLSARLTAAYGPRQVLLGSLAVLGAGLALAIRTPVDPSYVVDILPVAVLVGAGGGLAMPAVLTLCMAISTPAEAGVASGLSGTSGMVGDSLGIAALAVAAASYTNSRLAAGDSHAVALTEGFHLAAGIATGLAVAAFLVGLLVLRRVPSPPGPPGPGAPPTDAPPPVFENAKSSTTASGATSS